DPLTLGAIPQGGIVNFDIRFHRNPVSREGFFYAKNRPDANQNRCPRTAAGLRPGRGPGAGLNLAPRQGDQRQKDAGQKDGWQKNPAAREFNRPAGGWVPARLIFLPVIFLPSVLPQLGPEGAGNHFEEPFPEGTLLPFPVGDFAAAGLVGLEDQGLLGG